MRRSFLTESTKEVLGFFCFSEASIKSHDASARNNEVWMSRKAQQDTCGKE